LKNKTEQELKGLITERREALRTFRFDIAGSKARNVKQGRAIRKEIAQILTELNARKTAAK
ncbi:MAG TPA: 50S ribosomal protein L29, partial [Candidatus Paceibacterota bacterium]|nr:50S ribosomal protein L29 [Candidatus Paceibacterota bacterium]